MIKVGITGGIGTGKTLITKVFEIFGIPVYHADDRAKWLIQNDQKLITQIAERFGKNLYDPALKLDRKKLASIVFQDKEALRDLNQLVHPIVFHDHKSWINDHLNYSYTIKEAAILIESGGYEFVDKIIVVDAPQSLRINRVCRRDQVSISQVQDRIKNQMDQEERKKHADFIIQNDGSSSLLAQCSKIHQELIALSILT